jgi:hypothetical protein
MKKLIRKPWLRRLIQVFLVIASLLVLTATGANRWAAGEKHEAVRKLASGSDLVESAKSKRPMPPDSENFAMIPLLVQLREDVGKSESIPGGGVAMKLEALGADQNNVRIKFSNKGAPIDLAIIAGNLGLSGTAAEMLKQFDGRHRQVLDGIRQGLELPHAVLPEKFDPANPREAFTAGSGGLFRFMSAARGLALRADLAIAAGQGEVALESLLMARRLSDLAFSEVTVVAKFVAWNVDQLQMPRLKKGIDSGVWDRGQLVSLRNAWSRRDTRDGVSRSVNFEGVAMAVFFDHAKRDRDLLIELVIGKQDLPTRLRVVASPDAWFDANSAGILNRTGRWLEVMRSEQPLQIWWDEAEANASRTATLMDNLLTWWGEHADTNVSGSAAQLAARAMVDDALVQLACQLAEHREMQGSYPRTLGEIGGESIVDPLTGKPFVYRLEGDRFVLYSIGPDGIDGGGDRGGGKGMSYRDQPDWVW